jgi:hypothetical protein
LPPSPDHPAIAARHATGFARPSHAWVRAAAGAALGACSWIPLAPALRLLPDPIRFVAAWILFTAGPGAVVAARLTSGLPALDRGILLLGLGSAATPILIEVLGRLHGLGAFPYVACALAGAGIAAWRTDTPSPRPSRFDLLASAGLVALAAGLGAVVFWHRVQSADGGLQLHGNYDSLDLSFYSVWAADASHTIPPTAAYYAGHGLNGAYYPQLVLAMVHRFTDVPLVPIYFGYAWPAALALGALCGFVFVRSIAPAATAWLAVVLIVAGGDFSYLAAWGLPHATNEWDYLLWPTNFLSPTMEVLYFNTWAQTLPVFFTMFVAIVQALRTRRLGWTIAAAVLVGTLFQFKVFAFAVMIAALAAAALFSIRDRAAFRTLVSIVAGGIVTALPFMYSVAALHEDRRTRLLIDLALLPRRMLIKLDLVDAFWAAAGRLAPAQALQRPIMIALATALFFAGGLGIRWLGLRGAWRAIRGRMEGDTAAWRVLAWTAAAGIAVPFVLVTDPYVDTLQFYQTGLYALWIFTALPLAALARTNRLAGSAAIALAIGVSLPSSLHFLGMKWTDADRPPLASIGRGELRIANYLRSTDAETTVVLHDRPTSPSLVAVLSDRRVVLAWAHPYYAVNSAGLTREIEAFFDSEGRDPAAMIEFLQQHRVTHVVVNESRDRVHPDVLARLQVVVRSGDTVLYDARGLR